MAIQLNYFNSEKSGFSAGLVRMITVLHGPEAETWTQPVLVSLRPGPSGPDWPNTSAKQWLQEKYLFFKTCPEDPKSVTLMGTEIVDNTLLNKTATEHDMKRRVTA